MSVACSEIPEPLGQISCPVTQCLRAVTVLGEISGLDTFGLVEQVGVVIGLFEVYVERFEGGRLRRGVAAVLIDRPDVEPVQLVDPVTLGLQNDPRWLPFDVAKVVCLTEDKALRR